MPPTDKKEKEVAVSSGTRHTLKLTARKPVFFCATSEQVDVLDAPAVDAKPVGKLGRGECVRALAEKYERDAFFVRIERILPDPSLGYHCAPAESPGEGWICISRHGENFAAWSSLNGNPISNVAAGLDFNAIDHRFAEIFLDV
jgi:hypothetical protein